MKRKKRRNGMLPVILVVMVTFLNIYPVTAAELPGQSVLTKGEDSKKLLDNRGQKEEQAAKTATSSNAQKPEAAVETPEDEGPENENLKDEDLEDEGPENEDLKDEDLKNEDLKNEDLEDEGPEEEDLENFVWVWSDKTPILMESEEGDDLSSQLWGMTRTSGICPTYEETYEAMIGMKDQLYEGMPWTNFQPFGNEGEWGKYYRFQGGSVKGASLGVGCAAFVFMLSDEAFGDLPARTIDRGGFRYEDVKVGDILRVNNSHFVIVLRAGSGGVTVAEGNHNKSVHWGRVMSKPEVLNANFIVTRYPAGYSEEQDAEEIFQSGTEDRLSWTLTNGGTLSICGTGAMTDYTESKRPNWEKYADKINQVIIEDGVESIGCYAFYQSPVMSVQIPETVTGIKKAAFAESGLTEITVPGSVKEIGEEAFYNCQGLKSATFYEGVKSIGVNAFHKCGIAYLDFPASITSVGAAAFMECDRLVQVRFAPGGQKVSMGNDLFSECWYLSNVTLPLMADKISSCMFFNCKMLTHLYIPKGIEIDGMGLSGSTFAGCASLRTIDFGGTENEWITNGGKAALKYAGLEDKVTVNYNVAFEDPFAEIPGDPGEFVTCEHVDKDGNGRCDLCDSVLSTDPGKPVEPGDDKEKPDNPGDSGNGENTSGGNSGGNQGGSGGSSGGGSHGGSSSGDSSSGSNSQKSSTGESVHTVISTSETITVTGEKIETVRWSDGTVIMTTTDATGAVKLEVELPKQISEATQREYRATTLPIAPIRVTNDITKATPITIHTDKEKLQGAANPSAAITDPVKIWIPVEASGAGTVAVLVKPDGSAQVIESSALIEGKMVVPVLNGDTVKIVDRSKSFADVPADAWYKEAVNYVTARDLFHGVTETTFDPAAHMTCATLVTALARLEGLNTRDGMTWYERGISWAVANEIMDAGVSPESTATSDLIPIYEKYFDLTIQDELPAMLTRAEAAQMLWNLRRCRP